MISAPFRSESLPGFLAATLDECLQAMIKAPGKPEIERLWEVQRRYAGKIDAMWRNATTEIGEGDRHAAELRPDPRFRGEEWREDKYFNVLKDSYLTGVDFLHDLIGVVDVDARTRQQLRFATRQLTDALSPANFLATNPEALALARETNGESILAGIKNLITDLTDGQIAITDRTAFEVGGNLATTAGAVVYENELIQLIQYSSTTESVHAEPVLIVPPCINRFYVLDLQPDNSFVRYAVEQGHTVFLISWRSATAEIAHLTWDDYLAKGIFAAVEVIQSIRQVAHVHALGFCIGGTLLGCAAAVARARGEAQFASLTLLTTMLDFSDAGEIGLMVDPATVAMKELTIGKGGLLYGSELASVFSMLRANDLVWPYVVNNYLKGAAPTAFDILHWNADSTNLPGPMYCWYLRSAYLENAFRKPGATVQCGVPVDLVKIDMPVYVFAAREDHIVPWTTAFATTHLVGGDCRFVLGASGHIAGVINPVSRNKRSYWVEGEQAIGPQTWSRTARERPGSWWQDWSSWLGAKSGALVSPPPHLGSPEYPVIEPAPGRYVRIPAERNLAANRSS